MTLLRKSDLLHEDDDGNHQHHCRNGKHHQLEDGSSVGGDLVSSSPGNHPGSGSGHPNDTTSNGTTELVKQWPNGKGNPFVTVTKL